MLPVLFSIGPISVSSFGLFLSLAFLVSTFLVWRLARAWDLNEERVLDLILLIFFGSLIGSRVFFVLLHLDFFIPEVYKAFLVTKYPGLSFWGGLLGGWLTLFIFSQRFKFHFWQVADLASIGFLSGIILGDIGCFLGGCSIGVINNLIGVSMIGAIGKRFPVQIIEALVLSVVLIRIWPKAIHFHPPGQIVGLTFLLVGIIKFILEFFRDQKQGGFFFSLALFILGFFIFLKLGRKGFKKENKLWYNEKISWRLPPVRQFLRKIRVKPTPENI